MHSALNRRQFSQLASLGMLLPAVNWAGAQGRHHFRIRTLTAGLVFEKTPDLRLLDTTIAFLRSAKREFASAGYEVQTLRLATPALATYLPQWLTAKGLKQLKAIDAAAVGQDVMLSIGPVITADESPAGFASWASDLVNVTENTSFSAQIASSSGGIHSRTISSAAEAMARISAETPGGEGNFRFAATAYCPPGTPFFPAAWFDTPGSFSLGLESPRLLLAKLPASADAMETKRTLLATMNHALVPVEAQAKQIASKSGRSYLGMDTSPAPGLDASIGEVIERISGAAFGSASTLSTCALLTDVLKGLDIQSCGYSGLMLPVLEDKVLAQRAVEGRYGINDLLLYSSVCGTGLDVVPLPGDATIKQLAAVIHDVAALAHKYQKPLSARLFPVPGKRAGDAVSFANPYLTDSVVLSV